MADADPRPLTADQAGAELVAAGAAATPPRRRWLRLVVMVSVPLALLVAGAWFWLTGGTTAATDNAYVRQDKVAISAEVGGRIIAVHVRENQQVAAGALLYRLDPEPFRIQIAQADAQIAAAQVQVATLSSALATNSSEIAAAQDSVRFATETHDRTAALLERGFATRASMDAANHGLVQAQQALRAAQAEAAEDRARLSSGTTTGGTNPQIAAALAQRAQARLQLSRTEVRAPIAGIVTQTGNLQTGQMLVSGLPALTIVASARSWVEANFKETDLNRMRPGQPATIQVDAYPGLRLRGHVDSIGAGTGSEFSILPAQNANGNWVKVTQRVPVRIAIDERSPRPLLAGLTSSVTVRLDPAR